MKNKDKLISITSCARQLTASGDRVSRAGLSKYCTAHGLKVGGTEKRPLVDFDQVQQHRGENGMRSIMKGDGLPADASPAPDAPPVKIKTLAERREDPTFRKKEADAAIAELDLEERRGELVVLAEVEAGLADSFSVLRSAQSLALGPAADAIVKDLKLGREGRQIVRAALKSFAREMQAQFHESASRMAAELQSADLNQTHDRLMGMAMLAHRWRLSGRVPEALSDVVSF